jgi:hypothetical protein
MNRILLYSFIVLIFKIEAAEFVVFNVGQGNCNLFIPDQTPSGTQGKGIPPEQLAHLSPLGWEHIILTGYYRWGS